MPSSTLLIPSSSRCTTQFDPETKEKAVSDERSDLMLRMLRTISVKPDEQDESSTRSSLASVLWNATLPG